MSKIQHVRHLAQCVAHRKHLVIITATIISDGNVIIIVITIIILITYFDVDAVSISLIATRQMQRCGVLVLDSGPSIILHPNYISKFNNWGIAQNLISSVAQVPSTSTTPPWLQGSPHYLLVQANEFRREEAPVVWKPDGKLFFSP